MITVTPLEASLINPYLVCIGGYVPEIVLAKTGKKACEILAKKYSLETGTVISAAPVNRHKQEITAAARVYYIVTQEPKYILEKTAKPKPEREM